MCVGGGPRSDATMTPAVPSVRSMPCYSDCSPLAHKWEMIGPVSVDLEPHRECTLCHAWQVADRWMAGPDATRRVWGHVYQGTDIATRNVPAPSARL
jgi:hypothetical protein